MSLLMYRNGVLSADRRLAQIGLLGEYTGFDNYSKIYAPEDRSILIGAVGTIPSEKDFVKIKDIMGDHSNPKMFENIGTVITNNTVLFVFYKRCFFIFSKSDDAVKADIRDLKEPQIAGSGAPAATVLIRSGKQISNKMFYRLVSATTDSVSPVFDEYNVLELQGVKL